MVEAKAFPLDDTDYLAEDLRKWFYTRTTGVYSAEDNLAVVANNNMSVTVKPGIAYLNDGVGGIVCWNEFDTKLKVAVADNMLDRIDTVVFRWDKKLNATVLDIVKGDLAEDPVAKAPVRDANCYEIVLARINVPMGLGAVTVEFLEDTRLDEALCGLMRDGVTGIPTQQLYDQFAAWVDSLKDKLNEADVASLTEMIEKKSDIGHTHTFDTITSKPATYPPATHSHAFADITGKPSTYAPSSHTHDDRYFTESEINSKLATYKVKGDFAVVECPITVVAGNGTTNAPYPSGFNKNNCVIIGLMSRSEKPGGADWSDGYTITATGWVTGATTRQAQLSDSYIIVRYHNPVSPGSGDATFWARLVLMKV